MDARPRTGASFYAAGAWLKVNFALGQSFNQHAHRIDLDRHVIIRALRARRSYWTRYIRRHCAGETPPRDIDAEG